MIALDLYFLQGNTTSIIGVTRMRETLFQDYCMSLRTNNRHTHLWHVPGHFKNTQKSRDYVRVVLQIHEKKEQVSCVSVQSKKHACIFSRKCEIFNNNNKNQTVKILHTWLRKYSECAKRFQSLRFWNLNFLYHQ